LDGYEKEQLSQLSERAYANHQLESTTSFVTHIFNTLQHKVPRKLFLWGCMIPQLPLEWQL